jgi:hypothetical protein
VRQQGVGAFEELPGSRETAERYREKLDNKVWEGSPYSLRQWLCLQLEWKQCNIVTDDALEDQLKLLVSTPGNLLGKKNSCHKIAAVKTVWIKRKT